jgi:hypothetical protein
MAIHLVCRTQMVYTLMRKVMLASILYRRRFSFVDKVVILIVYQHSSIINSSTSVSSFLPSYTPGAALSEAIGPPLVPPGI